MKKRKDFDSIVYLKEKHNLTADDAIKIINANKILIDSISTNYTYEEDSLVSTKTYFEGADLCCMDFKLSIEVQKNDDQLTIGFEEESQEDLSEEFYNIIVESINYRLFSDDSIGESTRKLLNNESYIDDLNQYLNDISTVDNLTSFHLKDRTNSKNVQVNVYKLKEYIESIDTSQVEAYKVHHQKIDNCYIRPVMPYLEEGVQKKWKISFDPILPEGLKYFKKKLFYASLKDDEYIMKKLNPIENKDRFGVGDSMICDISYDVIEMNDDVKITNVEIRNVKEHH